jgi:hypothetical protein
VYRELWGRNRELTRTFQERLRRAWNSPIDEKLLADIRRPGFPLYPYRQDQLVKTLRSNWGGDAKVIDRIMLNHVMKPLCRASKLWQDAFVDLADRNLGHYGTSGQYLDQLSYGGMYIC